MVSNDTRHSISWYWCPLQYLSRKEIPDTGSYYAVHTSCWLGRVIVTLCVTSPGGQADEVLFTFSNGGTWENAGVASLVGILTPWSSLGGYDSSVHMTENANDASKTIPPSLMTAYAFNPILAFIATITMIFCVGDVNDVLSNPAQAPFIIIFLNPTKSRAATVILTLPIMLCFFSGTISEVATASLQMWSFARDGAMPFSSKRVVVYDSEVPNRAVWTTIPFT